MGNIGRIRVASAAALMGGVFGVGVMSAGPASASGTTAHGTTTYIPVFVLNPFVGPALTIPPGCPFTQSDENWVFAITGNSVNYGVDNQNGGWGGGTVTGAAALSRIVSLDPPQIGPPLFVGQATAWFGGGDNLKTSSTTGINQGDEAETFHFKGVSTDGTNTPLDVSISYHGAVNNNGTLTSFGSSVTCS